MTVTETGSVPVSQVELRVERISLAEREYPEYWEHIREPRVRAAFRFLVEHAEHLTGYTVGPQPHGYVKRDISYRDSAGAKVAAFTVARDWLRFYVGRSGNRLRGVTEEALRQAFARVNVTKSDLTFEVRSLADARAAVQLLFPASMACRDADFHLPEEPAEGTSYYEGAVTEIRVNRHERSAEARAECIRHYGTACTVCGFSFQAMYGKIGAAYIHVHHLVELASIGGEYAVDPVADLRPVCANCHAMLHRTEPALTIAELRLRLPVST